MTGHVGSPAGDLLSFAGLVRAASGCAAALNAHKVRRYNVPGDYQKHKNAEPDDKSVHEERCEPPVSRVCGDDLS